jgi:KDO2-lipid IV(A) lauroyltransferase
MRGIIENMLMLIRGLFRAMGALPLRVLHILGGGLGWAAYLASSSYRSRFRANVQRARLAPQEVRPAIAHAGRMAAELPFLWLRPPRQPLGARLQWGDGAHLLDEALDAGRGLVLLTPHLGCFEVCAQAYAERCGARQPMTALYRPSRKAVLRELEETARHRPGLLTAPASLAGVRQMLRALRQGQTVGLLPDQVPPQGMGVWAPFFGDPAYTMTLASRLVLQTGASWLLMACERLPGGRGYAVHVSRPPEPLPGRPAGGDDTAHQTECAAVINRAMEHLIRQYPGQYLWGYNRYKAPREGL